MVKKYKIKMTVIVILLLVSTFWLNFRIEDSLTRILYCISAFSILFGTSLIAKKELQECKKKLKEKDKRK
jgi:hypothetical protein